MRYMPNLRDDATILDKLATELHSVASMMRDLDDMKPAVLPFSWKASIYNRLYTARRELTKVLRQYGEGQPK